MPLTIRMQQTALRCAIEIETCAQRGEHVVDQPAVVTQIARVVADHPWSRCPRCKIDQRARERALVAASAMALHLDRDPATENFPPFMKYAFGFIPPTFTHELRKC